MLKRVFVSYAESSADKVDHASISRDRFLELLEDLELCQDDASSDQALSLDSSLGQKFTQNESKLHKKDAQDIFDMLLASMSTDGDLPCNDANPVIFFFGFLVSLQMISKRIRRPLNDVLADITFS